MMKRPCYRIISFMLIFPVLLFACRKNNSVISETNIAFISNLHNKPVFSWKLANGSKEISSQILISGNLRNIQNEVGDLWDSGQKTMNPVQTIYEGKPLKSGEKYFARIYSWNDKGEVSSRISEFFTPVRYPDDWKAKWITYDYNKKDPLPVFMKIFQNKTNSKIDFARLYICAPGFYEAYLNGKKIGENVLDPGQTNYDDYAYYTAYPIDPAELKKENSLGIMLGNGWYNQNQVWGNGLPYGPPVLICQLVIQYKNGEQQIIGSNPSWKYKYGPVTYSNIYGGETYDANFEVDLTPEKTTFQEGWENAVPAKNHPVELFEQFAEPIKKMGIVNVQKILDVGQGKYIFDFGENFSGWTKLKINGQKGQEITIRFAEVLDSTHNIDPTSTGVNATKVIQTSKYICKGQETEVWEPRFTYHGFRYAEVTGLNTKPEKGLLTGVKVYSSVSQSGNFSCSEENINRLHELAVRTIKANIHSIPTDCPHRERCGWTGDAHALALSLFTNFDAQLFMTKYMLDMRSSGRTEKRELYFGENFHDRSIVMKPKGIPTMIVPGKRTSGIATPDWGTAMVQIPWYLYLYYGDAQIIQKFYPDMKTWVEYIHSKSEGGIIPHGLGDWCPPGGNENIDCPVPVSSTAFHILDVSIMKQISEKLGYEEDFQVYFLMLDSLKQTFNARFFNEDEHTYGSQTADAMALDIGIVPENEKQNVAASIVRSSKEKHGGFINTGIFGLGRIFKVLCENGFEDEAHRLLSKKDNNSFATMWDYFDATSLWEVLPVNTNHDKKMLYGRSHSHPMQAGFDSWFYSGIAGINPTPQNPGFKQIIFKPYMTEYLTHAQAEYESVFGMISSSWRWENDTFYWDIVVPANTAADVYVPVNRKNAKVKMNESDTEPNEIISKNKDSRFYLFKNVSSGSHRFMYTNNL